MPEMTIRDAHPSDAEAIARFNVKMALETEGRELDADTINAGVAAVLNDVSKGRYWVAEANSEIVGQLMVTYEWSDWRNGRFWWIQSVYVRPDCRRKGVFSALYRHVEALARARPEVCGLRLYVEYENRRAQKTYESLGMISPGYQVMEVDFRKIVNAMSQATET
jgi:ribosomal protein S18 acetylase RimI-like enzyme